MSDKTTDEMYFTTDNFYKTLNHEPSNKSSSESFVSFFKSKCNKRSLMRIPSSFFPILSWLPKYNIKRNLLSDILSGLTIGIFQIPQGMAYGLLTAVPPIYGLYTSFFPVIIYFLMGTSRHISYGSYAILSLMTSKVVDKYSISSSIGENNTLNVNDTEWNDNVFLASPIEVATAACLIVGVYELFAGVLHAGLLSIYMSDSMVKAFTTGSAVHVLFSQLKYIFGISLPRFYGPFRLIYTAESFVHKVATSNLVTLALSALSILLMFIVKELINKRYKEKLPIPIPIELVIVTVATISSYFLNLNVEHGVEIVGTIPTGLPSPSLPRFAVMKNILLDCIPLAVIGYTTSLSIAKIFARKHGYKVNANQELYAHGCSNIFASFFSCFPGSTSLSRSSVQEGSGCKTQIASLVSALLILSVLLFIGSLLESLPNCILSSIIVVALKNLLLQITELRYYWNISKLDLIVWIVTFISVTLLDVDYGLGIGILTSLLTIIFKSQRPKAYFLKKSLKGNIYVTSKLHNEKQASNVEIFYFSSDINFLNKDLFIEHLENVIEQSCLSKSKSEEKSNINNMEKQDENKNFGQTNIAYVYDNEFSARNVDSKKINEESLHVELLEYIIVDFSSISRIDDAGVTALKQVINLSNKNGIIVVLAACFGRVFKIVEKLEIVEKDRMYPSIEMAMAFISSCQSKKECEGFIEQTHM